MTSKIKPSGACTVVKPTDSVVSLIKALQFRTANMATTPTNKTMSNVRRYTVTSSLAPSLTQSVDSSTRGPLGAIGLDCGAHFSVKLRNGLAARRIAHDNGYPWRKSNPNGAQRARAGGAT